MSRAYHRGFTTLPIVLFAITLLLTAPAMATDFYVASGGVDYGASGPDSKSLTKSNGCSDSKTPCGSITHATALAKSGDVINLGVGLYSEGEAFPLFIRKGVTLQGAGDGKTIIEGSGVRALIIVEADSADIDTTTIIRNIKIRGNFGGAGLSVGAGGGPMRNGLIKSGGGGMNEAAYSYTATTSNTTYTLSGYNISGNSSDGIYVYVSNSYVANVSFKNNTIYNNYTGIYVYVQDTGTANVNFTSNYISNNSSRGVFLYANASSGTAALINANFQNNYIARNGSSGVGAIAYYWGATVSMNMIGNSLYYNWGPGVAGFPSSGAWASLYMRSNKVSYNSTAGVYFNIDSYAGGNLTMVNNTVNNNSGDGVYIYADYSAWAKAQLTSNSIYTNSGDGVFASAADNYASVAVTMLYNKVNSNSYSGLYLYADTDAYAFGNITNNSFVNNSYAGIYARASDHNPTGSVYMTLSRNYIANNSIGFLAGSSWTAQVYVNLKNNIFYNNTTGISGFTNSTSSVFINAGPYGAKTGLNTFNNLTNNIVDGGAVFNTDNNWWDAGEATWNTLPLDDPLSCTVSPTSLTTAGGAITVTAASGTTYFVDKVGALPKRLTVAVGGVAGTVGAVAAGQTSVTATAPAMAAGTYSLTVTNAGGQICTTTITYTGVAAGGGGSSNSPPYDATGGGTDWLYYPEDAQTNVPTGTVIKWTELTDANGDTITYTLYLCHKDDWDSDANDCTNWIAITGITANASALRQAQGDMVMTANAAGAAGGAMLFAIGFIGAMRSRRGRAFMMALMMIASAGMIASCSTDSDDDTTDSTSTYTVCTDEAGIICEDIESSYTLDANTEYHWYVNASDGAGGTTDSDTRSFTTGD